MSLNNVKFQYFKFTIIFTQKFDIPPHNSMSQKDVIDDYISQFPEHIQLKLNEIKSIIEEVLPEAEKVISYKMPAYKMKSVLVYFAGYEHHIGFYPTATGIEKFNSEFGSYKWSKGAVQFPIDEPLPKELIQKITLFKLEEELLKLSVKKSPKSK